MNNLRTNLKIYRPAYWRCFFNMAVGLISALLILWPAYFIISNFTGYDFLEGLVRKSFYFILLCPVLAKLLQNRTIILGSHYVTGKKPNGFGRVSFCLSEIDRDKSNKRNFFNKLFGYQHIHSFSGDTIVFDHRIFHKKQRDEILKKLELELN